MTADPRFFTADDVQRLLLTVIDGIHTGPDVRTYTLPEVAKMTHTSLRALEDGVRDGTIDHTRMPGQNGRKGKVPVLTARQISDLLAANRVRGGLAVDTSDSLAGARAASQRNARRGRRAA